MQKEKKDVIQNFKIPSSIKKEFNRLCNENHTTASHELRVFTYNKIKEFKDENGKN